MKKILTLCLFVPITLVSLSQLKTTKRLDGNWSGQLKTPLSELTIIFHIHETGRSTMDVPQQGAKDIPVTGIQIKNDSIMLEIKSVNGNYKAEYQGDTVLKGSWEQGIMVFPLSLKKNQAETIVRRPQTPAPPFPYTSEDVIYKNKQSGFSLAGTLTLPGGVKKSPAVILISGSGTHDRDETIFEHKPFLVMADYLTRNGIAVLRVDDRGIGGSEGKTSEATSLDFAGDVMAGIEFLKSRREIDKKKIGLIGHSEGGLIAPVAASSVKNVAFLVLLAGPGMTGEQLLYEQNRLTLKAAGMGEETIKQNELVQKTIFDILKNEKDSVKYYDRLRRVFSGGLYPVMNSEKKSAVDLKIKSVDNPWFKFFLVCNPVDYLKKVKCPVLALNGEKDVQVAPGPNLAAIENALKIGGNKNVKVEKIPGLNHLFQHCISCSVSEYGLIEETFSPEVLKIISDWIKTYNLKLK